MLPISRPTPLCFATSVLLGLAGSTAQALDAGLPPGGNFNLTNWYLGLPVDSSGGTSGNSASIPAAQLVSGYSNALYFYTGADGAMTFWAPVTGATTPGSSYPRSELREQISPPSNDINWSGYGTSILTAQCRVVQVPSTKKVIIGQIHTKTGAARPLVKLQYNDGVIEGLVKQSPNADPDSKFFFPSVGLSNLVNYTIRMEDGLVTMTVNGSTQSMDVFESDPEWADQEFYFKAGSYCQDNSGSSSEGARVAFYSLMASHPGTNDPPPGGITVTNVIVDDSFADADRAPTGLLQANWWSSSSTSGNSIEIYTNQLGLISGTSGRGIHGTFTPQLLGIGDTIRATYTFTTPATVVPNPGNGASFKVALMEFNNAGLAADLSSSSSAVNPLYTNLPGYMVDFDVNTGASANTSIREHETPNTIGRFLGTTTEWISSGTSAGAGYVFAPNTEYVGVLSITRTDLDSMDIFSSLSQGEVLMDSFTSSDSSGIANDFGLLGFWVNSSTFGNTTAPGELQNNGITFSNIKVEVVTFSAEAPTLNIALSGDNAVLSWTTNGTAGYGLQSTPSLSAPSWTGAGSASVVGDMNYVTNALIGDGKYYRLRKP